MSALDTLEAIFVKEITEAAKTKPLALVVKPSNATASSPELVTFDLAVFDTFTRIILATETCQHLNDVDTVEWMSTLIEDDQDYAFLVETSTWLCNNLGEARREMYVIDSIIQTTDFSSLPEC